MIQVTPTIAIAEAEFTFTYIRAPGPGGQNVNKVASAAQLRFDAANCPAIVPAVFARLRTAAGQRMTAKGEIVITAHRFRSQERNRQDAIDRLTDLIQGAAAVPKHRRPTKPGKAAKQRRLDTKRQHSQIKKGRQRVGPDS